MIGDKKPKQTKKDTNYIDNSVFTKAVADWVEENKQFNKRRAEWSRMPEFVGECIMKIVDRFALSGNWRGYTYIDEMKAEAINVCVRYSHNFDIKKSGNAFAYFTQLTYNAFLQVMAKEKNQTAIKTKAISESSIYNTDSINLYIEDED